MPTIELSTQQLLNAVNPQMSHEELAKTITFLGVEVESIDEQTTKAEVFPDRPDLLSEVGLIRAIEYYLGKRKSMTEYEIRKDNYEVICEDSVKQVRPFTRCCVIKNLKLDQSKLNTIIQIQEKLHITFGRNRKRAAIGIYPLEEITFPIRYKAMKPQDISFVPLDSSQQMNGLQILQRHPKGKEFAHLLEKEKLYPIFIDAQNKVLSMPPVINSEEAGRVTTSTTEVFIECSGHNEAALDTCIAILATAMAEIGGTIYETKVTQDNKAIHSPQLQPRVMHVQSKYVEKRSGLHLKKDQITQALSKMGLEVTTANAEQIEVLVPRYREDILHPIDIVEEICVGHGYENIKPEKGNAATVGSIAPLEKINKQLNELLTNIGYTEAYTYVLNSRKAQDELMRGQGKIEEHLIALKNPANQEHDVLRCWLAPTLMETLSSNKNRAYPQSIFTQGTVVIKQADANIKEEERTAFAQCAKDATYTTIKQHFEYVFDRLGIKGIRIIDSTHSSYIAGRCGRIVHNEKSLGFIGEVHPQVIKNFGLTYPVVLCELLTERILKLLE